MRVLIVAFLFVAAALPLSAKVVVGPDRGPQPPKQLKDVPVQAYRLQLLELAWQAATSYPLNPHIKNRGRAEEQVVLGAVQMGQLNRAWGYTNKVVNWRKGACYAEIAGHLLDQGETEHVEYFLKQALRHSKDATQGWRHKKVKTRVSKLREKLAKSVQEKASDKQASGKDSKSSEAEAAGFAKQVKALDALVAADGYDEILSAMSGYADLYATHYADTERRKLLLDKTRAAWKPMPGLRRFETVLLFADAAIEHGDHANAKTLIDEADTIHQSFRWSVDYDLRLRSDLARYRVLLKQTKAAKKLLADAVVLADRDLKKIENFYRAGALRPVAEGYAKLGDTQQALKLYARVIDLGAVNPNIRPRVTDITASCTSMALHGIKPDAELLGKIKKIVEGLGGK